MERIIGHELRGELSASREDHTALQIEVERLRLEAEVLLEKHTLIEKELRGELVDATESRAALQPEVESLPS